MHSSSNSHTDNNFLIETIVKNVMAEMKFKDAVKEETEESTILTIEIDDLTIPSSPDNSQPKKASKSRNKKSSKDKKKNKNKKKNKKNQRKYESAFEAIEKLLMELEYIQNKIPSTKTSREVGVPPPTPLAVGSVEFYRDVSNKLGQKKNTLCMHDGFDNMSDMSNMADSDIESDDDHDFDAAFSPIDMRCLALVSHNEMKATMKDFVIQHKQVLKKFRLTGTNSTMKMLAEVFADEEGVVFGPSCSSGPLGGDAELVALMTSGKLGGILFFQDPMTSHPHQCDIECLVRQAIVHNTVMANTPASALALMEVFKIALLGVGKAELIPSFFFDLQSPTVQAYKNAQSKVINSHSVNTGVSAA